MKVLHSMMIIHHCFAEHTMVDTSDAAWQQARLSLSCGGLGLCHLSLHSPAAYRASVIASDYSSPHSKHPLLSIDLFNGSVSAINALTAITTVTTSKLTQKMKGLACLAHQLGYLSHLPQSLASILIPLSFKLPLSGG